MGKFKVGDKVIRIADAWPEDNMFNGNIYTVNYCNKNLLRFEECSDAYLTEYFQLVSSADDIPVRDTPETYTESELSYIEELESRVVLLEELCEDYAKEVDKWKGQYDAALVVSKQIEDFDKVTKDRILAKVDKLTNLVSTNKKAAKLINADIGDCVLSCVIDYLRDECNPF